MKFQEIDGMEKGAAGASEAAAEARSCPESSMLLTAASAGLLDIESLDRDEIESILDRARFFQPLRRKLTAASIRCAAR